MNIRSFLNIAAFARQELGFEPDPLQTQALNPSIRRGLLNCCRQWGKSTTVAVRAVHHALASANSLTVVVSPCARQSGELVRKAESFFLTLGLKTRGDGDNEISILLPNGSRIVGLPGNQHTIRGFSKVGLLLIDEASRVPDDVYHAVRPMIAANRDASLWLLSTPNGRQGFFYREWTAGGSQWTRIEAPATACPRIDPAFVEEERRQYSDAFFRQEYLCEFITADFAYFDHDLLESAFAPGGEEQEALTDV